VEISGTATERNQSIDVIGNNEKREKRCADAGVGWGEESLGVRPRSGARKGVAASETLVKGVGALSIRTQRTEEKKPGDEIGKIPDGLLPRNKRWGGGGPAP